MRHFTSALAAVGALTLASTAALAMPVTHNLSMTIDAPAVFDTPIISPVLGVGTGSFYAGAVYTGLPLTYVEGDTIELEVTVNGGGIVMNDGAATGLDEILFGFDYSFIDVPFDGLTDNPNFDFVISYDRSTTVTVTNYTGDLANSTIMSSINGVQSTGPLLTQASRGNYTDSTVSITQFTISSVFTNINFLPGFEIYAGSQTLDTNDTSIFAFHEFAGVPAPGALALLGFGLVGLGLRRSRT